MNVYGTLFTLTSSVMLYVVYFTVVLFLNPVFEFMEKNSFVKKLAVFSTSKEMSL